MSKTVIAAFCILAVLIGLPIAYKLMPAKPAGAPSNPDREAYPEAPATPATPGVPTVVTFDPPNGATNVSPATTQLRVTFSEPMRGGFSWTGGGESFPKSSGQKPYWMPDGKTCVLPVSLEPNKSYRCGLNSPSHKNFKSANGVPLTPVVYTFSTGP